MARVLLLALIILVTSHPLLAVAELTAEERYQQARAQFAGGEYAEVLLSCDPLLADDLSSPWQDKAAFLKADAHAALKQYDEAASIYEQQAKRLLSPERRDEIARVFLRFAQAVAVVPDAQAPDAVSPDYEKARRLYEAALKLDVSTGLREAILFLKAETQQHAEQWTAAIEGYQEYLREFDSTWQMAGMAESSVATSSQSTPHLYQAHLSLATCQLATGEHAKARIVLEDLLRRLEAADAEQVDDTEAIRRDASYQLIQVHRFPQRVSQQDFQYGLKAAQDFLGRYPEDPHSVELAYQIAQSYERHGRSEDAISAYHAFIAQEGSVLPKESSQDGESPREVYERLVMEATYQIGSLLFDQSRFTEAAATWEQYVRQFPDGPRWTEAQRRIVDTEFQIGLEHLNDNRYAEATTAWDAFLESHPLDARCPQILFTYGQMKITPASEDEARSPELGALTEAIALWERLIQKYPGTDEASLALFRIGEIYEQRLGQMEQALEAYRRLTWGSWAQNAQSRIAEMTQKRLRLLTERTYRTHETPRIRVKTRNIEKLSVSIYHLDLASYWRRYHSIMDIEQLDIGLIEPDQSWEWPVPDYTRYRPLDNHIEIPMEGPGACLVHLSDDDFEATTLVLRSDLDAIVKSSRRQVFIFAQEMLAMAPAHQAHVLITDSERLVAEGTTNADGVYQQELPMTMGSEELSIFISRDGHIASNVLDVRGIDTARQLRPRGHVYTDRPAYQPGQRVSIRGIVHEVQDGTYTVVDGAAHTLTVLDARGRVLHEEQVSLSEFGTFHTQVVLDSESPTGEYRMHVQSDEDEASVFTGTFLVERFRLETVHLDMEFS